MKLAVIIALATMFGCLDWRESPSHHYAVYISPNFSDSQANIIMGAVTDWQVASGNFITFNGVTEDWGGDLITVDGQADIKQVGIVCDTTGNLGCTVYDGIDSTLEIPISGLDDATFKQTVTHEFGHALGLMHSAPGTIMCADSKCASRTIQCADIQQLAKVWNNEFDPNVLPICK